MNYIICKCIIFSCFFVSVDAVGDSVATPKNYECLLFMLPALCRFNEC